MRDDAVLYVIEPRGTYARRVPAVVDASVIATTLFNERRRVEAASAIDGMELHAPDLLDHELVSVALKKYREGAGAPAREALEQFGELEVTRHKVDSLLQWEIASQHGLSAYDAAYLCVSIELGCPLITLDQRLGEVARKVLQAD